MSAEEELRKWNTALDVDDIPTWEGTMLGFAEAMAEALPEIIAVVETAQYVHDEPYESEAWWNALGSDLAALRAKLEKR